MAGSTVQSSKSGRSFKSGPKKFTSTGPEDAELEDSKGGVSFVADDDAEESSISRLAQHVATEGRQPKGQSAEEGSVTGRSTQAEGASCHPLAKKCDAECDEPDLNTAQYWRKRRYSRREALWRVTDVQRCAYCGRVPYSADQGVTCYRKEWTDADGNEQAAARIEGVQTCGNVNLCPVCARDVRRERAAKINRAVRSHLDGGGGVLEFLFTLRHGTEHSLRQQLDAMKAGWAAMMQASSSWGARKVKEKMGHVGHYWKNEAPWNPDNGWHVHRHGVLFTEEPLSAAEVEEVNADLFDLYKDAVQETGMPCPTKELNNVVSIGRQRAEGEESIGGYMMKTDSGAETRTGGAGRVGEEVARGDEKQGKKGLMPFQLLDLIGQSYQALDHFRAEKERVLQSGGDATWKRRRVRRVRREIDLWESLWSEYEQAVEGEKMMQGSRGFDDELVPDAEDEEPESSPREEAEEQEVGEVPSHLFRHLSRFSGGVSVLHETIEGEGYIRREGNRIVAVGEGEPVDLGELIEALRLDWWRTEVDESEADGPIVGVQYLNRINQAAEAQNA